MMAFEEEMRGFFMNGIHEEKSLREQAEEIVREQPALAEEIFKVVAATYQREDILERIAKRPDVNVEDFSDEEIDELAAWFGEVLESNDLYWATYWKSADKVIDDYLLGKNKSAVKSPVSMDKDYRVDLYYGYEESSYGVSMEFVAVDPKVGADSDEIADGFAEALDVAKDDSHFNYDRCSLELPNSLVTRIQEDAIKDYLAKGYFEKNTKVTYRYADASNYHARNTAVLRGVMTEEQRRIVLDCLDGDGLFVPGAVGLDATLPWAYDPQEDHPFWGLDEYSFEETSQKPTVDVTVEAFVAAFVANKDKWEQLGVAYTPGFDDYKHATVEEIIEQAGARCDDVVFGKGKDRDIERV